MHVICPSSGRHPLILLTVPLSMLLCTAVYLQDVFGYQEMFQVQASACPPALQVRLSYGFSNHVICTCYQCGILCAA
jgi:hypothetical protein